MHVENTKREDSVNATRNIYIVLLVLVSAIIYIRSLYIPHDDPYFRSYLDRSGTFVGVIDTEPDATATGKKFVVRVGRTDDSLGTGENSANSFLLVKTNSLDPRLAYGTKIEVSARIQRPETIVDKNTGRAFDYPKYLAKDGVFYIADRAKTRVLSEGKGNFILTKLYAFKHAFMLGVEKNLPAPHSFLANGLVISGKGSMSKELQLEFQKVGLIHIVVLSGSNISIIGEAIVRSLSFLPILWSSILGGIGIVLFSCMTGGGATVVRSAIMSIIALTARVTGRQNRALVSLVIAGSCMLIWNPLLLFYDPSFQLSFAASLGLILYSPRVSEVVKKTISILKFFRIFPERLIGCIPRRVREFFTELVSSSVATQIATLPLILKMSGMVSVVSLPVNLLLLPLIPYTMLAVFVLGVVSFISASTAMLFTFVSWVLLTIELGVVHKIARLNFAVVEFSPISDKVVLYLYTSFVIEFAWFLWHKNKNKSGFLREKPAFI